MDAKEALKYFKGQTNEMQFISGGIRGGKSYRQEAYKAAIEALEKIPVLEAENARLRESSDKWTDLMNKAGAVGLTEADFFKMVEPIKNDKE